MKIDSCVDWLSWSVKYRQTDNLGRALNQSLRISLPELKIEDHPTEFGRKPYTHSYKLGIGGRVFFNPDNETVNHFTVEIEGRGCRRLSDAGLFDRVAQVCLDTAWNITRFDLAVDLETKTTPGQFAAMRSGRFTTTSHVKTQSGWTEYVGSSAGDKQARVYRYYPPHERSHLLRVEMVYRKKTAREALLYYLEHGPIQTAATAGMTYDWSHPDWKLNSPDKITNYRTLQGKASTLWWMRTQVIHSLQKLDLDHDHPLWSELLAVLEDRTRPPEA